MTLTSSCSWYPGTIKFVIVQSSSTMMTFIVVRGQGVKDDFNPQPCMTTTPHHLHVLSSNDEVFWFSDLKSMSLIVTRRIAAKISSAHDSNIFPLRNYESWQDTTFTTMCRQVIKSRNISRKKTRWGKGHCTFAFHLKGNIMSCVQLLYCTVGKCLGVKCMFRMF